ncbi:Brp/Blh family beta-carotene 15,15'-dioxygenase [Lacibacter sp.]|uniref:Brp/Blh family beta-carotene 15,15'-dioxygenase n=1 Tax=Lacibacter sp. TaxID=1915409 RepID=UPI002B4B1838|nr:Brp/Blh family beta-carotene 15,15'-dioxygenase [Lacibacter sp.]HLP35556.1 Brp/Blh family beta-carotene 15,15'-dioxygenase [Lacibacter sp.]
MIRILLLLVGLLLLIFHAYISPLSTQTQFVIFLVGIVLLGVPHGAADLLVANQTADHAKRNFSKFSFLFTYVGRLGMFAAILWFLPVIGNFLFIAFAAYHFGETDLHRFKTNTIAGKLFVFSYGLLILGVILLQHFHELKSLFAFFESGRENENLISFIDSKKYLLLSICAVFFFASTFFYFSSTANDQTDSGYFLLQLAVLLLLLFHLPMLIGFTFYFIVWHSVLSLTNIVIYLRRNNVYAPGVILKQIVFYSGLAMAGVSMVGFGGFMFVNTNTILVYVFLGLAVLTAPHMQIMHDMYNRLRLDRQHGL